MSDGALKPIPEEPYPLPGQVSPDRKTDKAIARENLSHLQPQKSPKTVFSTRKGPQNQGPKGHGHKTHGPQQRNPRQSGWDNKPNSPSEGAKQANRKPSNKNHTQRDENPEINDTRFLQWTVSAYKEILRDNCHLLNVSSKFRPPVMTEYHEGVPHNAHDDEKNIMNDWNTEYQHAQMVLNVCRKQLRLWLMEQYVIKNSNVHEVNQRYNLDFKDFKTSSIPKKNFEMSPAKWFKDKFTDFRPSMYTPIQSYIMRIYSEERKFLKNVIQKFVELVEKELPPDTYDHATALYLGLIEFTFDDVYVQEWTSFYNDMKNKDENKDKKTFILPKIPPACNFAYSNDPNKQTNSVGGTVQVPQEFKNEHQEVYEMFEKFKGEYNKFYDEEYQDSRDKVHMKNKQTEFGLRIWFHARAWNAFRKAIQSNLIKKEERAAYMRKNRINNETQRKDTGNKYFVLGSPMALALPAASRPSYLVSL